MSRSGNISENSRRIARNTVFLYCRMLLLMLIGLFTFRIVLKNLGETDYGVYNVVGGFVMMFTMVTTSVSAAISRFLAFELGKESSDRLPRVFATAVLIQLLMCAALVVFTETAGLWYLNCRMNIPPERLPAANWVLQCSMGLLAFNLLSVPFNSVIIAHERMDAFALLSILEAVLKLSVALLLSVSPVDKLKTYAVLMLVVGAIVRLSYGIYCRRNFEEARSRVRFEPALVKEMASFAGWNFLGSGVYVFNTQGVNILSNKFFGVLVHATRGNAAQVENIVRQFAANILTAINPQITKSWAAGNRDYAFELVCKGAKYSYLMILAFVVPVVYEADKLLEIWLEEVPASAALFSRLVLVGLLLDLVCNTFVTLVQATGNIRRYYLVTSAVSILIFPLTWLSFKLGGGAFTAYLVFVGIYVVLDVVKIHLVHVQTGFKPSMFLKTVILPVAPATLASFAAGALLRFTLPDGWPRMLALLFACTAAILAAGYAFALTEGEKAFVRSRLGRGGCN